MKEIEIILEHIAKVDLGILNENQDMTQLPNSNKVFFETFKEAVYIITGIFNPKLSLLEQGNIIEGEGAIPRKENFCKNFLGEKGDSTGNSTSLQANFSRIKDETNEAIDDINLKSLFEDLKEINENLINNLKKTKNVKNEKFIETIKFIKNLNNLNNEEIPNDSNIFKELQKVNAGIFFDILNLLRQRNNLIRYTKKQQITAEKLMNKIKGIDIASNNIEILKKQIEKSFESIWKIRKEKYRFKYFIHRNLPKYFKMPEELQNKMNEAKKELDKILTNNFRLSLYFLDLQSFEKDIAYYKVISSTPAGGH